jgi:hypothetical protein
MRSYSASATPVGCTPQALPVDDPDGAPLRADETSPFQVVRCEGDAGVLDAQQQREKLVGNGELSHHPF